MNHNKSITKIILFTLFTMIFLSACEKKSTEPEKEPVKLGLLKISYELKKISIVVPSYQTVAWLQDGDGKFFKSLFVSEWLAYGGYNYDEICPTWNKKADWKNVSESQFDAVTAATPRIGHRSILIDCEQQELTAGIINVNIETHIVENYNVLYSANVEIGSVPVSVQPEAVYIPEKHARAGDVLTDVQFEYYFEE